MGCRRPGPRLRDPGDDRLPFGLGSELPATDRDQRGRDAGVAMVCPHHRRLVSVSVGHRPGPRSWTRDSVGARSSAALPLSPAPRCWSRSRPGSHFPRASSSSASCTASRSQACWRCPSCARPLLQRLRWRPSCWQHLGSSPIPLSTPPWLDWLGLGTFEPVTNDYVPVFPWFAMVLLGMVFARLTFKDRQASGFRAHRERVASDHLGGTA